MFVHKKFREVHKDSFLRRNEMKGFFTLCVISLLLAESWVFAQSNLADLIDAKEIAVKSFADQMEHDFQYRCAITLECTCSLQACQSSLPSPTCEAGQLKQCSCPGNIQDL